MGYSLDPYAILAALEERRVDYILIGSLARVLQGADEIPAGLDLTLSKRTAQAGDAALHAFGMRAPAASHWGGDALVYWSQVGVTQTVAEPRGAAGYDDLRRKAERVHLGRGLRPRVASPGDLVRMLEALGRLEQVEQLEVMRRVVELDRGLGLDR